MTLSNILNGITYDVVWNGMAIENSNYEKIHIEGIETDSNKVKDKFIFVCIIGYREDGHNYIYEAYKRGCRIFLIQDENRIATDFMKVIKHQTDVIIIKTINSRRAIALMAKNFYGKPDEKLITIGITGTKGKTTTTYMIKNVLEGCGIKTGLIGTIETVVGKKRCKSYNTTPEALSVYRLFAEMVDEGCRAVVMEVSSQGLKLDRVHGIFFDIGVFTNLSLDHIGDSEHKNFDEYLDSKALLFKQCRFGIANGDDRYVDRITKDAVCPIEYYGIYRKCDLNATNISLFNENGKLGVCYNCEGTVDRDVKLFLPGEFSVYNSLCGIMVASHFIDDEDKIINSIKDVQVKGRVELIKIPEYMSFTLLIDYAHNAMSLESLLLTLRKYNPNRLICLFGCGGNRSVERRYSMGEVSGRLADFTVVTSDNPRFENPSDIIRDIDDGLKKTDGKYIDIEDRRKAIAYVIENAQAGDIVVLAGKGHEDYQEIDGVRYPMDERDIVADYLATHNECVS